MSDGLLKGNISLNLESIYPTERGDGGGEGGLVRRHMPGDRQEISLTFFAPRHQDDEIVRPLDYHLNAEFVGDLLENVNHAKRDFMAKGIGQKNVQDELLHVAGNFGDTILPSSSMYRFGRRNLNDMHRFVLTMTNVPSNQRLGQSREKNHVTYTGWCLDEPISHNGSLNPNCELVFTHFTHLRVNESMGERGYLKNFEPMADCDILSIHTADLDSNRSSDRDFLVGPDHILDAIQTADDNDDFESITSPMGSCLSRQERHKTVRSVMNSPHRQLARIMTGLTSSIIQRDARDNRVSADISGSYLTYNDRYANTRTFRTSLEGDVPNRVSGPQYYQKRISLGSLMDNYPRLEDYTKVIVVEGFHPDRMDEEDSSLISICSAYLKTAIPPVFADHGISYTYFRYATYDKGQRYLSMMDRLPQWELGVVDPYLQEPKEQTELKFFMACEYLRKTVFATIEQMAGPIDVFIDYKSGAETIVHLQLMDFDAINPYPAIYAGDLGGLISPQVGSQEEFAHGERLLTDLLDTLDATDRWGHGDIDRPPLIEDDRADYVRQGRGPVAGVLTSNLQTL